MSGLELWQYTRKDLLNGCLFWESCLFCKGTGRHLVHPELPCPDCSNIANPPFVETGGLATWSRFAQADLAGFHWSLLPGPVTQAIQGYARQLEEHLNAGRSLILTGGVGSGKTHLAVGMGILAMGLGRSAYAVVFADLLLEVKSTWQPNSRGSESRLLEYLGDVDLLILDDLGVERDTPWAVERLTHLVNLRYVQQRATLVTTNLTLAQLESRLDPRVLSRLLDGGQVVGLTGVGDYRRMGGGKPTDVSLQTRQRVVASTRTP